MPRSAVVRIYATTQDPDYDSPWQARVPSSSTGSGVVIGPGLVLTGAHVVANSTFLQVQKISDPNKAVAQVAGICHDCDLALLKIDAPLFMTGVAPAEIGDLPDLRDRVSVIGFPVGGEEVSITEGVVSRIEVQRYSHSQRHLLAVTVDAAINKGNSGGPVFKDGKVVGIAFQKLSGAEGIGEMVPPPIIRHFLGGIASTPRLRIPTIGIATQGLENPTLRESIGMTEIDQGGVLVLAVEYGGSAWGVLRPGDAILTIEGAKIASNSTIQYLDRYRTRYDLMLGWKDIGADLTLEILRDRKRQTVKLSLKPQSPLVPRSLYDIVPTYFIYGGLVFQTLTRDFLATWDNWWDKAPKEFLHLYYSGIRTPEKHEVVILTQILADQVNVGYEHLYSESIVSVNGRKPRDMHEFVDLVESSQDTVEFKTSSDGIIVLGVKDARTANERILERYRIGADRSIDLAPTPAVHDSVTSGS